MLKNTKYNASLKWKYYIIKKIYLILLLVLLLILAIINIEKYKNELALNNHIKNFDNINGTNKIPILVFHRIVPDDLKKTVYRYNRYVGSLTIFNEMIKYIFDNGYKTISSEEFYKWYIGDVEYDNKTLLITLDDGFYEDYYLVYPIIKKYNLKATSFVVGSRIKEKTASYYKYNSSFIGLDSINKIRMNYPFFEFQSHSFNMHYKLKMDNGNFKLGICIMSYRQLEIDTLNNKKYGFTTMAYPFGVFNKEIKQIPYSL